MAEWTNVVTKSKERSGPMRFATEYGADLAALACVLIWGNSFAFQKVALEEIDSFAFSLTRYLGMLALGWGVLVWMRARGASIVIERADLPRAALTGILGYSLYVFVSTIALAYTTAFSSALLMATSPLFAAMLLWVLGLERVGRAAFGAMLLSFAGVAIFMAEKVQNGLRAASYGDLLVLLGAACFAAYSVVSKPLVKKYPIPVVITQTMTIGAVPAMLLSIGPTAAQDWGAVSPAGWASLAWTIVAPVYLAWSLWGWAIGRGGVARTSAYMNLVPVFGAVAAWLVVGEGFSALKMLGAGLALAGLVLTRYLGGARIVSEAGDDPVLVYRVDPMRTGAAGSVGILARPSSTSSRPHVAALDVNGAGEEARVPAVPPRAGPYHRNSADPPAIWDVSI